MPYSLGEYLLLGFASIILSGLLTPVARKFARHIGAMDLPNLDRKIHKEPVPYLGGLSIALTTTLLTYTVILVQDPDWSKFRLASYVIIPALILATTNFNGIEVVAAVKSGNITAFQFHPEKSQKLGLALIANYLRWRP